ncbi:MAG: hypothetical protein M3Y85_05080 [Bacteroidota bacterium]|nr:hypothetical protein [Bacteroidota bacterium]
MKIIFLCGSIEPGRDGVGDYIRRLASELIRQGNGVGIISLNDRYAEKLNVGTEVSDSIVIPFLRNPSLKSSKPDIIKIKKWIDKFSPDLISLQFVPFSFSKYGLPFFLNRYLSSIAKGKIKHVMFHEIWVGLAYESSLKLKILGSIQRLIIKNLMQKLKPDFIDTNTTLYRKQLFSLGYASKYLPLFSNIPNLANDNKIVKEKKDTLVGREVSLILFGTLHPGAPVERFTKEIALFSKEREYKIILKILGRAGKEQFRWEAIWQAAGLEVENFGERSFSEVSLILGSSTIGITTNPIALIEKSGSVAAMLDHQLPVLSLAGAWRSRKKICLDVYSHILPYSIHNLEQCLKTKMSKPSACSVSDVANKFLEGIGKQKKS